MAVAAAAAGVAQAARQPLSLDPLAHFNRADADRPFSFPLFFVIIYFSLFLSSFY